MGLGQRSLYQGSFEYRDVLLHVDIGQGHRGEGWRLRCLGYPPRRLLRGFRTFRGVRRASSSLVSSATGRSMDFPVEHIARPIVAAKRVERTSIYPRMLSLCRAYFLRSDLRAAGILATFA